MARTIRAFSMIPQHLFDALADELVAEGTQVSYSTVQAALVAKRGHGVSDRDLQQPYADWRQRRRYKGHLARLDLPEEMEKAIATFAATAMRIAEARAQAAQPVLAGQNGTSGLLEQMQRIVGGLERQLASLADDNRALRDQLRALQSHPTKPEPPASVSDATNPGFRRSRKSGAALIAATAFWDKVVSDRAARILALGRPMSMEEMVLDISQETKDFAALAFQKIDKKALEHKITQRIDGKKYGLFQFGSGLYSVIPLAPDYRQFAALVAA